MARDHGEPHGKTECWYVLEAEPGAAVALGLKPNTTLADVERSIEDHTLEDLLRLVPVKKDDMIFVDAGTVHAIFPGVVMLETQQNSDMTYRLYDYGRHRELHLKDGLKAIRLDTEAGPVRSTMESDDGSEDAPDASEILVRSKYFRIDRTRIEEAKVRRKFRLPAEKRFGAVQLVFVAEGAGEIRSLGAAPIPLRRGELAVVPACVAEWSLISSEPMEILRAIPE